MAKLLIIYHSQSGNTLAAAKIVADAAGGVEGVEAELKEALKADADDLLSCDAIAVGSPDYFSYMAGGVKDFFDRAFYPTQGSVTNKPCGIFLSHGGGGRAVESLKSICGSFKFNVIAPPVMVTNSPDEAATAELKSLAEQLAEAAKVGPIDPPETA